jgi:hypothetical protein
MKVKKAMQFRQRLILEAGKRRDEEESSSIDLNKKDISPPGKILISSFLRHQMMLPGEDSFPCDYPQSSNDRVSESSIQPWNTNRPQFLLTPSNQFAPAALSRKNGIEKPRFLAFCTSRINPNPQAKNRKEKNSGNSFLHNVPKILHAQNRCTHCSHDQKVIKNPPTPLLHSILFFQSIIY